jgi:hypothetical protein
LSVRASAHAIADDRRTQTVTYKQLDEALDSLPRWADSHDSSGLGLTPYRMEARAQIVADIVQTLTEKQTDRACRGTGLDGGDTSEH